MKRKNRKIIFEATGLLLVFLILVNTGLQSTVAVGINDINKISEYQENKDLGNLPITNLVIAKGSSAICLGPENLNNFNGEILENGARGIIKNTDIYVYTGCRSRIIAEGWLFLVIPQIFQPESFIIKSFSGWIEYSVYCLPHGIPTTTFSLIGISENIQPNPY